MAVNRQLKRFYPESTLLGHTFVDGTAAFYNSVNGFIGKNAKDKVLLDLGCGRGSYMDEDDYYLIHLQNFKGRVKKVIGVDVDIDASANPAIDEFRLLELNKPWPIDDASVDICVSDWVVEHIADVSFFFSELNRVLKKGGYACFRTTNKFSYIALCASLIPNSLHSRLLVKVQSSRKEKDVFPTVYKCNTKKKFSQALAQHGFEPYIYYHDSEPNYLKFSYLSFAFGYYLQKFLPAFMRTTILAFGMKK
jgi:SAM-dependent methyltransferase